MLRLFLLKAGEGEGGEEESETPWCVSASKVESGGTSSVVLLTEVVCKDAVYQDIYG